METLNLNVIPKFEFAGFRKFFRGEKHITRTSSEHVLLLMIEGKLTFFENGKRIDLVKNEYYIQKAGLFQEGVVPSLEPYYYFIHFKGDISEQEGLKLRGNFNSETMYALISKMDTIVVDPNSNKFDKTLCFFEILNILRDFNTTIPALVSQIYSLVEKNYQNQLSLDSVSKELGYSKNIINKTFKKYTGITPHQYLLRYRISRVKILLLSSSKTLQEIADECGFNDISTLYRNFLKISNMTPYQFRKNGRL